MLIPIRMKATNFVFYETLDLNFGSFKDNLVFITGTNLDTAGSESNGAGKSILGDLLTDLLFDKTIRRHSPESFIGKFAKWTYEYIAFKDPALKCYWYIKKYRNHHVFGSKVFFLKKMGEEVYDLSRKTKADTYTVINRELNINWGTFCNRNFFGQRDFNRFLNVADTRKAEIIIDIRDLHDLQKCKKLSHETFRKVRDEKENVVVTLNKFEGELRVLEDTENRLCKEVERFKEAASVAMKELKDSEIEVADKLKYAILQTVGIEKLRFRISSLKHDIEEANEIINKLARVRDMVAREKAQISLKTQEKGKVSVKISQMILEVRDLRSHKSTVCDKCGVKLTPERVEKVINDDKVKIKECRKEVENLEIEIETLEKTIVKSRKELELITERYKRLGPKIQHRESLLKGLRIAEKWEAMVASFKRDLGKNSEEIKRIQKQIEFPSGKSTLETIMIKKNELLVRINTVQMLLKGISIEEAKHELSEVAYDKTMRELFDDFLTNLNLHSSDFLDVLSDNDISVFFKPKKEMKSKKVVDEITVEVSVNGEKPRDVRTYSGGEISKIEFSTQMALFSSAESPIALLWFDEPFVGTDGPGRDRMVELLRQKADEGTKVLVITHHDVVSGYGETINIVKKDGKSYIE